jgi:glutathione S-transferase
MRFNRIAINALFFIALPLVVAIFGLNLWSALGLVLLGLLWRWALAMVAMFAPPPSVPVVLETVAISHYVDKVRWCLDRLGVPYREVQNVTLLIMFFTGRTVPRLHIRTGGATSRLGDSPAILRYLWGAYACECGERAEFLKPAVDALDLEEKLDQYGVWLQQWFYYHLLPHRRLTLHVWGVNDRTLPIWQRLGMKVLFPAIRAWVRRGLKLGPDSHQRTVQLIEKFLGDIEQQLSDGRRTLLGGKEICFVDITLAALSGLWLFPPEYGGGRSEAVRLATADYPPAMATEIEHWREKFPQVTAFVERLYKEERYLVQN